MMVAPIVTPLPDSLYYYRTFTERLERAIFFVGSRPPEEVRPQFPHLATLLKAVWPHTWLHDLAVELVVVLYPWPKRWGFTDEWLVILQSAIKACHVLRLFHQEAEFLRHLAERYLDMGNFAIAIETGQKAITLSQHHRLPKSLAWAALVTHRALIITGRIQEADHLLTTIADELSLFPVSSERKLVDALLILMRARKLREQNLSQNALELMQPLIEQIEFLSEADGYLAAYIHSVYGWLLYDVNRFDVMLVHLQKAVDQYEKIGDTIQADVMRGEVGYAYMSAGEYDTAERVLLNTITQVEQHHWQHKLIQYMGYLAGVYLARGEPQRALLYVEREATLSHLIGSIEGTQHASLNRGSILLLLGQHETGLATIQETLLAYQASQDQERVLLCLFNLSFAYLRLGQKDKGEAIAQEIFAVTAHEFSSLPHLSLFARRCLALFRPPVEATELLQQALAQATNSNSRLQRAACLISLAGLVADEVERYYLWQSGVQLLEAMNAVAWVDGYSPGNPPFIGLIQ